MRSYFFALSVFFCVITAQAQINVDPVINHQCRWVPEGTAITITARAAYHYLYADSVDVVLDTWPDLGEFDNKTYQTMIYIDCPWGLTAFGYEMNLMLYDDLGLAGYAEDSVLVVAETGFIVPMSMAPEADLQFGITWFGYAFFTPLNGYPECCADAGYRITTPPRQFMR